MEIRSQGISWKNDRQGSKMKNEIRKRKEWISYLQMEIQNHASQCNFLNAQRIALISLSAAFLFYLLTNIVLRDAMDMIMIILIMFILIVGSYLIIFLNKKLNYLKKQIDLKRSFYKEVISSDLSSKMIERMITIIEDGKFIGFKFTPEIKLTENEIEVLDKIITNAYKDMSLDYDK